MLLAESAPIRSAHMYIRQRSLQYYRINGDESSCTLGFRVGEPITLSRISSPHRYSCHKTTLSSSRRSDCRIHLQECAFRFGTRIDTLLRAFTASLLCQGTWVGFHGCEAAIGDRLALLRTVPRKVGYAHAMLKAVLFLSTVGFFDFSHKVPSARQRLTPFAPFPFFVIIMDSACTLERRGFVTESTEAM